MRSFLLNLLLTLLLSSNLFCQVNKDSLLQVIQASQEDTSKVLLLLQIADSYERNNQDSALHYLEKAKELSEKLNFKKGLYKYYVKSCIISFTIGDYKLATQQGEEALEIAVALKDTSYMINILANTGIINQYLGKYDKQLDYCLQALTLIEQRKEYKKLSSMYHNIGNAYFSLTQYHKCIEYCQLSLEAQQNYGGNAYLNRIMASLGDSYNQINKPDSALYFYKKAVDESIKLNDKYAEAGIYAHMANLFANTYDFAALLDIAKKSYALSNELQSRQMLAISTVYMAYAFYFNNDQDLARKYISDALEIAETDSLYDELKNCYTVLSYIAAKDGDYKTSMWAKSKTDSLTNAGINTEVLSKTSELQEKYESEKKNDLIRVQQIELHHQNTMNYFFLAAFIMILLLGILLYRNFRHRQKLQIHRIDSLETEKQLMATEAVLRGEEQERTRLAKDLHDGLGGMLSGIKYSFNAIKNNLIMTPDNQKSFDQSINMLDSSIQEMRRVSHNLMPESLMKFGLNSALKDFCIDINKSGALQIKFQSVGLEHAAIEQSITISIYRIVQELVNNIIKHSGAKTALVQVTKNESFFTLSVEDDGKGFDASSLSKTTGIGWTNIKHRVDLLKARLDIKSQAEIGTSVVIEFAV